MFRGKSDSHAIEVLDTLGRDFYISRIFETNSASRGTKVSILAFELANTIVRGFKLMQSLSKENIHILKKEILLSKGVQLLVSTDMKELLSIAAADKREESKVFWREVARFGGMCIDPQWHNLDRYFESLHLDPVKNKHLREGAEIAMQELANLAQHTFELYHEYHALGRFEQLYQTKTEEVESLHLPRKGKSMTILQSEVKRQRKHVRSLKKKSLWLKSVEEVVEKLVAIASFIPQAIVEAFEEHVENSTNDGKKASIKTERLGVAGLALHYANLITQMDIIASRSICVPPDMRDKLYIGLPASVKAGLRSHLQALDSKEAMTMPQIEAEMEKVLHWLIPIAADTTKAHQCFGCVGEWVNAGNQFEKKTAGTNNIIRLQTLYYADKQIMDQYILDLIIYLHRLISLVRYQEKEPKYTPTRSPPTPNGSDLHLRGKLERVEVSAEDKNSLEEVSKRRAVDT